MSNIHKVESKHDLLTNNYRPTRVDEFNCNGKQALQLRIWIQDFLKNSKENKRSKQILGFDDYDEYFSSDSEHGPLVEYMQPKCILLTGPTGVGKTSLVYTVAHELGLHVVESHSAEKRDFKLFTTLKLTNQKGRINPIAKLFQASAEKDTIHRIKRQKMTGLANCDQHRLSHNQQLLLSCDTSLLLFDDIDVVFEEDGPFLKSLVDFIAESKRPIVVTATRSIDSIKKSLNCFEHIHLDQPSVEECAKLLQSVCSKEEYDLTGKKKICLKIANYYNCDIRRCLNKIQFYGNQVDKLTASFQYKNLIHPSFDRLKLHGHDAATGLLLSCYSNQSIIDLMEKNFKDGPYDYSMNLAVEFRNRGEEGFGEELGKQIRDSIQEATKNFYVQYLMTVKETAQQQNRCRSTRSKVNEIGNLISERLITRIEPHEYEFFTDIVPLFGEVVKLEALRKGSHLNPDNLQRRSRRTPSYLDDKGLYFKNEELKFISEIILDWME